MSDDKKPDEPPIKTPEVGNKRGRITPADVNDDPTPSKGTA